MSLVEESEGSIVDLAYDLYEEGDQGALREIESRLDHPNKVVRYYAAYNENGELVGAKPGRVLRIGNAA